MQAAADRRPGRNFEEARPLRRRRRHCLAVPVIIMYLVCVCLHGHGDVNLLAAAVPVGRRGPRLAAAGSHVVVGSRPIPAVVGAGGSSPSPRFVDDKRRIPSCPDALHNR
ncbi:hypothetical protein GQ55_5G463200 [Panicum hallii var. hallii]|uniref:Uncharacterized protein n=1 Tax=Panicum hallii var. hallii TaxID=1504633 RepID=A0A2T7DQL0_9POAL|nr:hypothetical protein GQ55_5G463200 [Panicum hallii var. hallii]